MYIDSMRANPMNESLNTTTPRDRRNAGRYIRFSALWAVVYVVCTLVLAEEYVASVPLRWLIAFIPSASAVFSARAYWQYLVGMDELLRAIELKALALSVSVGFVIWPAVELIEIGVPLNFHVPVVLLVMTGAYSYGLLKGRMAHL
jgi:hypothetical protein